MASCSICLDSIESTSRVSLGCHDEFHVDCIDKWLSTHNTCPICRKTVVCVWCKRRTSELVTVGDADTSGHVTCQDHGICKLCVDAGYLNRRRACLGCYPSNVCLRWVKNHFSRVENFMNDAMAMREHVALSGIGTVDTTEQYMYGVFTMRERPAVHWPYIETQLGLFMRMSGLRSPRIQRDRVWNTLVLLHNYHWNVVNALPSSCEAQQRRHTAIFEAGLDGDLILEIGEAISDNCLPTAWNIIREAHEIVYNELTQVP